MLVLDENLPAGQRRLLRSWYGLSCWRIGRRVQDTLPWQES